MASNYTPRDLAEFAMDYGKYEARERTFYFGGGQLAEIGEDGTVYRSQVKESSGPAWTEEDLLEPFAE
jgi:hypothetical protein